MKHLKIIFFGGSKYSNFYLDALKKKFDNVHSFSKLPPEEELKIINSDLGVIAYFGEIVPKNILEIPRLGFINVHYSLLPRWRGAAPIQYALLAGDKEIGVTILVATPKVDAGPILAIKKIPISPDDTYLLLEEKLIAIGSELLLETIPKYLNGKIIPQTQNESWATYAKKFNKEDGEIDWQRDAVYIEAMVRALNPWPGVYTNLQFSTHNFQLKIKKAKIIKPSADLNPGEFFEINDGFPAIQCGNGAIKLLIVQPEGKKDMSGSDFLRGHRSILNSD